MANDFGHCVLRRLRELRAGVALCGAAAYKEHEEPFHHAPGCVCCIARTKGCNAVRKSVDINMCVFASSLIYGLAGH